MSVKIKVNHKTGYNETKFENYFISFLLPFYNLKISKKIALKKLFFKYNCDDTNT